MLSGYGILASMDSTQRITVHVPADLLERARRSTGQGITATVREGLQLVAAAEAYRQIRALRGRVPVPVDIERLREDRD